MFDLEQELPMPAPSMVKTFNVSEYSLYLNCEIVDLSQFVEHIEIFSNASEYDTINLYISSNGGSLDVGEVYISHMKGCEAHIIGHVGVTCASMAAAIALTCDDLIFTDLSTMLLHQFSYGTMSTANDVASKAEFNVKLNKKFVDCYYKEMLTDKEYKKLMRNQDVLLDSDQLKQRWEKIMGERHSTIHEISCDEVLSDEA